MNKFDHLQLIIHHVHFVLMAEIDQVKSHLINYYLTYPPIKEKRS